MREPNKVFVQAGPSGALTPAPGNGNRWTAAGIDVQWTPAGHGSTPTAGEAPTRGAAGEVVVSAVGGVSRGAQVGRGGTGRGAGAR